MVGRLIEQQVVRTTEQGLGEQHPYLLVAAEFGHLFVVHFTHNAQTNQHGSSIRLCIPAVQLSEFTFKLAGAQSVCFCEITFGV
ncbi:hypothetical protein D3C74_402190 [compost metagenome]